MPFSTAVMHSTPPPTNWMLEGLKCPSWQCSWFSP